VTLGEFEQAVETLSRQPTVQGLLSATCRELVERNEATLLERLGFESLRMPSLPTEPAGPH
jgi:hypothetical protein